MALSWKHACLLASVSLPYLARGAEYKLLKEHSGPSFFEGFNFFDGRESHAYVIESQRNKLISFLQRTSSTVATSST